MQEECGSRLIRVCEESISGVKKNEKNNGYCIAFLLQFECVAVLWYRYNREESLL